MRSRPWGSELRCDRHSDSAAHVVADPKVRNDLNRPAKRIEHAARKRIVAGTQQHLHRLVHAGRCCKSWRYHRPVPRVHHGLQLRRERSLLHHQHARLTGGRHGHVWGARA